MAQVKLTTKAKRNRKLFYQQLEAYSPLVKKQFLANRRRQGNNQSCSRYAEKRETYNHVLARYLDKNPADIVIKAFQWNITPEGFSYWSEIDDLAKNFKYPVKEAHAPCYYQTNRNK